MPHLYLIPFADWSGPVLLRYDETTVTPVDLLHHFNAFAPPHAQAASVVTVDGQPLGVLRGPDGFPVALWAGSSPLDSPSEGREAVLLPVQRVVVLP